MHWNTHDRLSGMMRPYADPNVIYRVNRAMDNPDPFSIRLNQSMKNSGYSHAFDGRGLRKYPHREPNHNWMSAMMTGYMYGGREGMYAAAAKTTSCRTFRDEGEQSLAKAVPGMRDRPAHQGSRASRRSQGR
jgi:hypothetical protein